jgi:hypothetical protein
MGKIYQNQTALKIVLDTGYTFLGTETVNIKYKKSSGALGSFVAIINGTTIHYYVIAGDINEYGNWVFWSEVTFIDGTKVLGEPIRVTIHKEGEI